MNLEQIMDLAKNIFGEATQVLKAKWGEDAHALLLLRDEYGKHVIELKQAGHVPPEEIQSKLEGHRRFRTEKIAEWELQKKWSAELADLVTGKVKDGPARKLDWLPKLILERFDEDFHHDMPHLRAFVASANSIDTPALVHELTHLPATWTNPEEQ